MRTQDRSWTCFGLLFLALAAGAIRMEERFAESTTGSLATSSVESPQDGVRCDSRLDAAWFGTCTHPRHVLLAGE